MATTTKHLPADERKAITVETVIELAARQNPGEITTAAIAQHMGLTQGALFRHFPSKDAIWLAVMEWVAGQLLARVEQEARNAKTPLAALEAIFTAHLDFITTCPGVPRILFHELQRRDDTPAKGVVQALITEYTKQLITILERGKANGELAGEINVSAAAALFLGMIQGLVMQSLITGDPGHLNRMSPEVFTLYQRSIRKIL
jgi:AcrR family transcriptional regulator